MKKISELFITIVFYLLAISCGNSPEQELAVTPENDPKSYRESLPAYNWLYDRANYYHDSYKDSVDYYFNRELKAKNYENAAAYLTANGSALTGKVEFDSIYFNRTLNFYNDYKDEISGEARTNLSYFLGKLHNTRNELIPSSKWFEKAIAEVTESKSHKQIQGFSNFAVAQNYSFMRDFEKAEKHLIDALKIFNEVDDITNQGTVYLLLHNMYMQKGAYKEAETNLSKGLQIVKEQNSKFLTFSAYGLFVHLNVAKADTISAIRYIDSLAIYKESYSGMPKYHEAILNQLLAFKHIAKREKEEALTYLKAARDITDSSNSADLQLRTLFQELMFAQIFDQPLKNPEQVEDFYNQIAQSEEPNTQYMSQLGTALFKFYRKKGEHEKALSYASFLMEDKNKALNELLEGRLFELERKYETEIKEKKILIQEKKLEAQKITIISLGVGALFIVLLFTLLIVWNKNRSILREKSLSDNFTSQLLSKTEDERKRIASDLHDSVSNELVNLRHALESNSLKFKDKIDTILEEVRNISRNLSPTLFDKLGLKESIEQLTERTQNQHSFLLTSDIEYNGTLNDNVELQLYRIIQEATTNIVKHADAVAGKITIVEDSKFVYAEIKDNGKGFDVDKMLEKGNCFGLLNITERTKFMNGTVQFKSDKQGTIIKISIPK